MRKLQKMHLEAELERLIKSCVKNRVPSYKHEELKEGDKVLVQELSGKEWEGPFNLISHNGSMVKVEKNEGEQDINRIRVAKFYDWKGVFEEEVDEKEGEKKSI